MTLIRSLASYYRQNVYLAGRHRFRPHELKAPRGVAAWNAARRPAMAISKAGTGSTPSAPPPSPPHRFPYFTWAKWALGSLLAIVLPFWGNKWRSLLRLEGEVEMVAEAVENAAEVVEKVATVTEKMAADAAESLPEDAKLKGAALFVENVSKEAADEAHLTQDIIHKVEELKQEVEMLIDPREKPADRHESHKD